jgi:hypothetical protein
MGSERMRALDGVPLRNLQAAAPVLTAFEKSGAIARNPVEKASFIFAMAMLKADVSNDWVAAELTAKGFRVSASLVSHWRNPSRSEVANDAHIAALGDNFDRIHANCKRQVNGWSLRTLLDVVRAIGDLAEEMSA